MIIQTSKRKFNQYFLIIIIYNYIQLPLFTGQHNIIRLLCYLLIATYLLSDNLLISPADKLYSRILEATEQQLSLLQFNVFVQFKIFHSYDLLTKGHMCEDQLVISKKQCLTPYLISFHGRGQTSYYNRTIQQWLIYLKKTLVFIQNMPHQFTIRERQELQSTTRFISEIKNMQKKLVWKLQYSDGFKISLLEIGFNSGTLLGRKTFDTIIEKNIDFFDAFQSNLNGINFIVVMYQEINPLLYFFQHLKFYQIQESELKYRQTIPLNIACKRMLQLSNNRFLLKFEQIWIIYDFLFQSDQIFMKELGQVQIRSNFAWYKQKNTSYFYLLQNNIIEIFYINETFELQFMTNITYEGGTIYEVKFLDISKFSIQLLINAFGDSLVYIKIINDTYYQLYLAQQKIGNLETSMLLNEFVLIPQHSINEYYFSVFYIKNKENNEVVYPIQTLFQKTGQHFFQLHDYQILYQDDSNEIGTIRVAPEYQILITELKELCFNIILSNHLSEKIIQVNIITTRKNTNYIWIVIASGCILMTYLKLKQKYMSIKLNDEDE